MPPTAIGFDLGDTLLEYEGLPLSWVAHYDSALRKLAEYLGATPSSEQLARGSQVLQRYNTRLNPREIEIPFRRILDELAPELAVESPTEELPAAIAFFGVFRRRLRPFADALPTLVHLRARGIRLGCFTDVPYGMPVELVREDLQLAGLHDALDVVITSRDAGIRKPAGAAIACLAEALSATAETFLYVGNEEKDMIAARAFGSPSILLDRADAGHSWGQTATIQSLRELEELSRPFGW